MKIFTIFLFFALLADSLILAYKEKEIICNYESWGLYRQGKGKIDVQDLDPNLCTIMMYTFLGISEFGDVVILDPNRDIAQGGLKNFLQLKTINPKVKLGVAIGGWGQGVENFTKVVADPRLRKNFIKKIVVFMNMYGFDILTVDWEYPCDRGGKPDDKKNFIELLKQLRIVFDIFDWLLAVDVGATKQRIEMSYDVKSLTMYADFINVMAYNFHGSWDHVTGHNAPLTSSIQDRTPDLNVKAVMTQWIKAGAEPNKLTLGLAFYGITFTLKHVYDFGVGAPTIGPGYPGHYTGEPGILSYLEICENLVPNRWQDRWTVLCDYQRQVPYAVNKNQWLSYENIRSISKKVDYALGLDLAGVMIWAVDYDDVFNACGTGTWPLLKAVNNRIKGKPLDPTLSELYC